MISVKNEIAAPVHNIVVLTFKFFLKYNPRISWRPPPIFVNTKSGLNFLICPKSFCLKIIDLIFWCYVITKLLTPRLFSKILFEKENLGFGSIEKLIFFIILSNQKTILKIYILKTYLLLYFLKLLII